MEVDNKKIGSRIKDIRLSRGWTLEDLGERLHTSKVTVFNWEKGRNKPNKDNLKKIADLGNITVDELLYGSQQEVALKAIDDALNEFIESDSVMYFSYEDDKQRYNELLRELFYKHTTDDSFAFSVAIDDPYRYIRRNTLRILEEEFIKGERNNLNMLSYIANVLSQAQSELENYKIDPLTQKAIKNNDITEIKVLEEASAKINPILEELSLLIRSKRKKP